MTCHHRPGEYCSTCLPSCYSSACRGCDAEGCEHAGQVDDIETLDPSRLTLGELQQIAEHHGILSIGLRICTDGRWWAISHRGDGGAGASAVGTLAEAVYKVARGLDGQ